MSTTQTQAKNHQPVVKRSPQVKRVYWRMRNQLHRFLEHHQYNFVYIHINKTGGRSIETALGLLSVDHRTALQKRNDMGAAAWEQKFKFAFVRNPWDRVVSHYAYRIKTNRLGLAEANLDFKAWLKLAYQDQDRAFFDQPKFFMPQFEWLSDENGQLIVDYVGRFETLNQDFAHVCEQIGRDVELPHVNKSNRSHYSSYYDDESIALVGELFAKDIEHFGYTFETPNA